jgi:3-hydroxyisobutyrate dehydrogenase-like beta-hydroxyacid dehydrogenase
LQECNTFDEVSHAIRCAGRPRRERHEREEVVTVIGVISPGAMGSGLADALARGGNDVVATLDGRSARTRRLASDAPFRLLPSLAAVVEASDVVLSVVPPAEAPAVAAAVARATGSVHASPPLLVDMNAVSPATLDGIERSVAAAGGELVDGSISGPPLWRRGTRVYLSGARAHEVAGLGFAGVDVRIVGDRPGMASALKMCTGSVYKGSALILAHALLTARANGVLEGVVDDLRRELPELMEGAERWIASSAAKSARYVGEMREIAATQRSAGLPPAVFEGIAEAYERISATAAAEATPEQAARAERLDEVLDGMAGAPAGDR